MSVELQDIAKRFAATAAVEDVNLSVERGEFLALLGPSGSGKTTLLRLIAGLEAADAGHIRIDGRDMDGVPARARHVGLVFQHYALFRHMTVAANIAFGLRVRPRATRPTKAEIAARVERLLDLIQLPGYGGRYPDQLSGGQRQRVALARALAIEPRVLLLDEPFGALDAQVRKDLRRWLRGLHDRVHLTTILVTHDQAEALELADRVAVMNAGRVEQVGTPAEVWDAPANAFVHGFLGDSLRVACMIAEGIARFTDLPADPVPAALPDGAAVAVIRPHEIALRAEGAGRVHAVSLAGPLAHVEVAIGARMVEITLPPGAVPPRVGAACGLDLARARFYRA